MIVGRKKKKKTASDKRRDFLNNLMLCRQVISRLMASRREIWGLDISLTNTGLTIYDKKKNAWSSFSHKLKGTRYQRMRELGSRFTNRVSELKRLPLLVIIEGYAMNAKFQRETMGEVTYAVKSNLIVPKGIPCLQVSPLALKKFVLGKSMGVDKKLIHKKVTEVWGADTKNHDESDSYALCMIGKHIVRLLTEIKISKNISDKKLIGFMRESQFKSINNEQWGVICDILMNDGSEVKRFFI